MPTIPLRNFSGIVPRHGARSLTINEAQLASNVKLRSGELRPWRSPVDVYTLNDTANVKSIYKLQGPTSTVWLEWNYDVNVVPSPAADVADYRFYFTSSSFAPRKSNWNLATTTGGGAKPFPNAYLQMGVPAPTSTLTLSAAGGSGATESRTYAFTYISTFGAVTEESGPNVASSVVCNVTGATVTVGGFGTAPAAAAGYNITGLRIYRTVTAGLVASYQFVDQLTINPTTGALVSGTSTTGVSYTTTYPDAIVTGSLGINLVSAYYLPPPSSLQGVVAMPNGILAGFTGNQVWFCEPYLPHAWPAGYALSTEFPIVGLGVFGTTLVVGTTKNPYLISGVTPGSMSQEKLPLVQPCVSKNSITSDQFGVLYACPVGMVAIGNGVLDLITRPLYTRDEWSLLVPTTMFGAVYNDSYLGFYMDANYLRGAVMLTRNDTPQLVTLSVKARTAHVERTTGNLYIVNDIDGHIYQMDADPLNNTVYEWKSKVFDTPQPVNFAAIKVIANYSYMASVAAYNAYVAQYTASNSATFAAASSSPLGGTLGDAAVNTYAVDASKMTNIPSSASSRYINITVYGDGSLVWSGNATNLLAQRLPAGIKATEWEIYITGNSPVDAVTLASSMKELSTPAGDRAPWLPLALS